MSGAFKGALLVAGLAVCCAASTVSTLSVAEQTQLTSPLISTPLNSNSLTRDAVRRDNADAPKYYHLNELLYKSASGAQSPQAAALPNLRPLADASPAIGRGGQLRPRGMMAVADGGDDANDESSIEGLVRRMRGRRPQDGADAADGGAPISSASGGKKSATNNGSSTFPAAPPYDEATIQRKSTDLSDADDGPEASGSPSRLRSRGKVPRRKRRASKRPPKLKARPYRTSRIQRRRRIPSIKPRRRA